MKAKFTYTVAEAEEIILKQLRDSNAVLNERNSEVVIEVPPPRQNYNKIAAIKYLRDTIQRGFATNIAGGYTDAHRPLIAQSLHIDHLAGQNIGLADAKRLVEELLTVAGVAF